MNYGISMDGNVTLQKPQKELLVIENWRKELLRGLTILLLVIIVFLFLRLFLKLIGANPDNIFTGFIYLVSGFFLLPYFGIVPEADPGLPTHSIIDSPAFLGLFCYIILIGLAMVVIQLGSMIFKSTKKVQKTIERDQPVDSTVVDEVVE